MYPFLVWTCGTFICVWQPAHNSLGMRKWKGIQGPTTLLMALLFLTPLLIDSWPAISLFAAAGMYDVSFLWFIGVEIWL